MKRPILFLVVLGLAASLAPAATPLYVCGDVPTTETATSTTLLPSQIYKYTVAPVAYTLALTLSGSPALDAIQKMDKAGNWLFSVEAADNLGGALGGADADPRDVIRVAAGSGTYGFFFCGAGVGVPAYANVDAVSLDGGDTGDLILSFDVPTTIGASTFDAADLVRFQRTGTGCTGWTLAAANPDFGALAAGVPASSNVIGADKLGTLRLLAFDVPTTLGVTTYLPGQIVSWNGASFATWEALAGWPVSSGVDGISWVGNPGFVPPTITVDKVPASTNLQVSWQVSCSDGALDYGIYEGTIGSWYSHKFATCTDSGTPLTEQITPAAGSRYYIVVPHNAVTEGSYGKSRNFPAGFNTERPLGMALCASPQVVTPCPP